MSTRVLIINLEFDCAGVGWNLAQALRTHTKYEVKHVMRRATFAAPHTDVLFSDVGELLPLCEWADVLHFNQWIWTHYPGNQPFGFLPRNEYGNSTPFDPYLKSKRVVYHFHGGVHQLRPDYWVNECKAVGATMLKCDPIAPIPGAEWIPNVLGEHGYTVFPNAPVQVAVMGYVSDQRRNNLQVKQALDYLQVQHRFFGEVPRNEALQERQYFSVTIDNITQGFVGMWTWEALNMGQVALVRLAPETMRAYDSIGPDCPIVNVPNIDHAANQILRLQNDGEDLARRSETSRAWMKNNYSDAAIANRYVEAYHA